MTKLLNLDALNSTRVNQLPYPYLVVENAIHADALGDLLNDFPDIGHGGSFALESIDVKPVYSELTEEFAGEELRRVLEEKFAVDLADRPVMVTARGYSRAKDGSIHTDSKTKLLTLLLYLNDCWQEKTGNLRILNNGNDLNDYTQEIPAQAGTLLVFKVTDNCWHGYLPFEGKRCSLQINYVVSDAAANKHNKLHRLSAKFKKLFSGSK